MAHIQLPEGLPGIIGPLTFSPNTAIHDTVLIAAAFCMYNRYVDGLATWAPTDPEMYRENGKRLADHGYVASTAKLVGA
jgi:hypothetical protein